MFEETTRETVFVEHGARRRGRVKGSTGEIEDKKEKEKPRFHKVVRLVLRVPPNSAAPRFSKTSPFPPQNFPGPKPIRCDPPAVPTSILAHWPGRSSFPHDQSGSVRPCDCASPSREGSTGAVCRKCRI